LSGEDLRRDPLESRKATLEMILAKADRVFGTTNTWKAMARLSSAMPAGWGSKALSRSAGTRPIVQGAARLVQDEELGCTGREARSGRGLGPVTSLLLKRAIDHARQSTAEQYEC
jgi:hypothetical protein